MLLFLNRLTANSFSVIEQKTTECVKQLIKTCGKEFRIRRAGDFLDYGKQIVYQQNTAGELRNMQRLPHFRHCLRENRPFLLRRKSNPCFRSQDVFPAKL